MLVAPIFPAERLLPSEAAPEIIDTPTNGTTNIFISWIKSEPRGANIAALSPMATPTAAPATIATNIQRPKFFSKLRIVKTKIATIKEKTNLDRLVFF